jgi:sigma-B regulation protein RsbU (phosphoserine phosphatase)
MPKSTRSGLPHPHVVPSPTVTHSLSVQETLLGASRVHDALCAPEFQRVGNFEIANSIVPARYVSGDFITCFETNGGWYLALGDLMGKGLSAAMWLAYVVDVLHRCCETGGSLPDIMRRLNQEMHQSRVGVPLTALFLAWLEPDSSILNYCSAGCPAAFLLGADNHVSTHDLGGPILGAVPGAAYTSGQIEFAPGDTLLAVSDGILEIHRGTEFELRPDHVINHLRYTTGDSASDIVKSLSQRIQALGSTMLDDLSVLAIKRVG